MSTLRNMFRAAVPRPWRVRGSLLVAEVVSASVRRELSRLASGSRPIVIGPWLGEVGFELLYWIPFVAWFKAEFGVASDRFVVISRGGVAAWYRHIGGHYCEAFDYVSASEFAHHHQQRISEFGEQKQVRVTHSEEAIIRGVRADLGLQDIDVLHPSAMYRVLRPYWWGHASGEWVYRHTHYQRLLTSRSWTCDREPYVAVKFYFNECFPPSDDNRAVVADTLSRLAQDNRVVSLSTGLELDDHLPYEPELRSIERLGELEPRINLDAQTVIVANATSFVGTYGGFAYLAPFYGVPATGIYSHAEGFSRRHLELALTVFNQLSDRPLLTLSQTHGAQVATRLAQ